MLTVEATMPPFYVTAATVLVALLITWLVAESRDELTDADAGSSGRFTRVVAWLIAPYSLLLAVGVFTSLWVQFRGRSEPWADVVVWLALVLGIIGVTGTLIMRFPFAAPRPNWLINGRRLVPALAAAVVGGVVWDKVESEAPTRLVGAKFAVAGTCAAGGCGLKVRSGPGASFPEIDRDERIADGTLVLVQCQREGRSPKGFDNPIWDRVGDGFVSDVFVETPNRDGGFSSGIPKCGSGNVAESAG